MAELNKRVVAERFIQSKHTYDDAAIVQTEMAHSIMSRLELVYLIPTHILEIGFGTGLLTKMILQKYQSAFLCLNELSDQYSLVDIPFSNEHEYIYGDFENTQIPGTYDLVVSNAVFQWFENPLDTLIKLNSSLNKDGILVFSTFGPSNLKEIKTVTGVGLKYYDYSEWITFLEKSGFLVLDSEQYIKSLKFNTAKEVIMHLKDTGVNSLNHPEESSYIATKRLLDGYVRNIDDVDLTVTYNPLIFVVQKIA